MATDSSFQSEDLLLCSICLEVFTDPVSTPCGHNFCKACINTHWKNKELQQCPLCKNEFKKSLNLCVNTTFRDVVENFNKYHAGPKNEMPFNADDVPCDCCLPKKCKASKTCLVCLASYCETHLESHHKVAALQRHTLTDPVQNIEEKICKKHNRLLESVCSNDPTPACVLCIKDDAVPLKEKDKDQMHQQQCKNGDVRAIKMKRQKKTKRKNGRAPLNDDQESEIHILCNDQCWSYSRISQNRGISQGRFYYEVHTTQRSSYHIGVVSESMRGRSAFGPGNMDNMWLIKMNNYRCSIQSPNTLKPPQRLWVCVDYEQGTVSFCDADMRVCFHSLTGCYFNEKVFLFYRHAPLEECPHCVKNRTTQKPEYTVLGFVLFFVVLYALSCFFF